MSARNRDCVSHAPWCPVCGLSHEGLQCAEGEANAHVPAHLVDIDAERVYVECEQGERYCTGADYAAFMVRCEDGSWICRHCDETARAEHEQDMRDRELEYRRIVFGR